MIDNLTLNTQKLYLQKNVYLILLVYNQPHLLPADCFKPIPLLYIAKDIIYRVTCRYYLSGNSTTLTFSDGTPQHCLLYYVSFCPYRTKMLLLDTK